MCFRCESVFNSFSSPETDKYIKIAHVKKQASKQKKCLSDFLKYSTRVSLSYSTIFNFTSYEHSDLLDLLPKDSGYS